MARIREKPESCGKETWFALGEGSRKGSCFVERLESLDEVGVKRCDERERELQKKIKIKGAGKFQTSRQNPKKCSKNPNPIKKIGSLQNQEKWWRWKQRRR